MQIRIFILKCKNYLRSQQVLIAGLAKLLLCIEPLLSDPHKKLKLYDFYLRFNPRAARAPAFFRKALDTSIQIQSEKTVQKPDTLLRSIILKPYLGEKEKGVLLVSFESELLKLANNNRLSDIENQYTILFIPSWQPFFSLPMYHFLSRIKQPFWIMPASAQDAEYCSTYSPLCQALPFQASSWVDSTTFPEVPKIKDIDIIMVATFMEYKRHWLLFEALRCLPKTLKVILLGKSMGSRTREVFLNEARLFGVEDRFELIENPTHETICSFLGRARLFCALSAKEGSFIAVAESLLSGTPVGMYENAMIGSKVYITPSNGILFNNIEALSTQLARFLATTDEMIRPAEIQKQARDNISAQANHKTLNAILREVNLSQGQIWSQDIAPFYCKNFEFLYYNPPPFFDEEYTKIAKEFSLEIERSKG